MDPDIQPMFPVYLPREAESKEDRDKINARCESDINQNFEILYQKIAEVAAECAARFN